MIELKKNYKKMGQDFTQVYKDNLVVVYVSTFPSVEVFKPQVHKPTEMVKDYYEKYPGNEAFGKTAWCCTSIAQFRDVMNRHFATHPENRKICEHVTATMNDRGFR